MKKLVIVIVIMVVALAAALSGCSNAAENLEENKCAVTHLNFSLETDGWQFIADKDYYRAEVYYNLEKDGEFSKVQILISQWSLERFSSITIYKGDAIRFSTDTDYLDYGNIYSIKIVSEYDVNTYYIYYVQSGEYEAS